MNNKLREKPYNTSYDPSDNYYMVLFKAESAVQPRELNDIQMYQQEQIRRLSNHLFKNGSITSGGSCRLNKTDYVSIQEDFDLFQFNPGVTIVGETSGVRATIIDRANVTGADPAVFFVNYTATGLDGTTNKFLEGEKLIINDPAIGLTEILTVRCTDCEVETKIAPVGYGSIYYINEGLIYFEGRHINFETQHVIVSKFTQPVDVKIGFNFVETIVTAAEDSNLLDNSLGSPNVSAPGADRLRIDMDLTVLPGSNDVGERFVMMLRVDQFGVTSYIKSNTEYSTIMEELARRNYETHGNYTIKPYKLTFLNHHKKDPSDTTGVLLDGDPNLLAAIVGPSTSYVMGFRNETIADSIVGFNRARSTNSYDNYIKRFNERSYVIVKAESKNVIPNGIKSGSFVDNSPIFLYSEPTAGNSVAGEVVGSFRVSDIELHDKGEKLYKLYVFDIQMEAGKTFEDVKGVANTDNQYTANAYRTSTQKFMMYNANAQALIFKFDKENIKTLRSIGNAKNGSIQIQVRKFFKSTLDASGRITFETTTNEFFTSVSASTFCYIERNGERVNVELTNDNITMSATSCVINLGPENGGAVVGLLQTVQRSNQKEKTKTLVNSVIMPDTAPTNQVGMKIDLKSADAYSITSVGLYVKNTQGGYDFIVDVTDNFKLNKNITDYAYHESQIELIKLLPGDSNNDLRLQIEFKYFAHSGNAGYFTVDSYSDVFNDQANTITYESIEKYVSGTTNLSYNLTQCIDFRPVIMNGNPNSSMMPAMGETMIYDLEYYLPRTDLLCVNKDGLIYMKEGIPSETPRPPKPNDDAMPLYEVYVPAYTYSYKDVKVSFIENQRFTMRDIGKIQKRVERAEYYITLNMAQKSIADMDIKDSEGFDRYKNGFVTDDFDKFNSADLTNREFKAALDTKSAELRPKFNSRSRKLRLNEVLSEHFRIKNGMITLPFESYLKDQQPFSTKTTSITPYLIAQKRGTLMLAPNMDVWTDTTVKPEMVHNIDTGADLYAELAEAAGITGVKWGDWSQQNSTVISSTTGTRTQMNQWTGGGTIFQDTTTVTEIDEKREGTNTTVGSRTDSYDLGEVVRDVQMAPYIRPQIIQFSVVGLAANTVFYPYFDKQNVSKFCRDIGFQVTAENQQVLRERMSWGGKLISDANGDLVGEFNVPEATFMSGQRQFVLTTNSKYDIEDDNDLSWSIAMCEFMSSGLNVESQNITLNVTTPTMTVETIEEDRKRTETKTTSKVVGTIRPPANGSGSSDPIAQGLKYDDDGFLTGLNVYFSNVDVAGSVVWFQIRTMINGYPTEKVLAEHKVHDLTKIPTSEDASVPYHIDWDVPVYLKGDTEYCWVVGGDSPATRIYVARLNQQLIEDPTKILEEQPNLQSLFRSLNGSTWQPDMYETAKYDTFFAKFDNSSNMKLVFNQINEPVTLGQNPIETENGLSRVRIHAEDHGFTKNDRVTLGLAVNSWVKITVDNAGITPQIGQVIKATTFNGIVADVRPTEVATTFEMRVTDVSGVIQKGQTFICAPMERSFSTDYIFEIQGSKKPITTNVPEVTGTIITDFSAEYPNNQVNGIPITDINKEHIVVEVDSIDSFIIETTTPANFTGRHGGNRTSVMLQTNFKYDVFNISGGYMTYGCVEKWNYEGTLFGRDGGKFEGDNNERDKIKPFVPSNDMFLDKPNKILSDTNEKRIFGTGKSVNISAEFEPLKTDTLTPVLNVESFSMITISNMIGDFSAEDMNVSPNAKNRFIDETDPVNGSATFKYVSRDIRLKDPASDLMILFDVYKDIDADFDVYWKSVPMYSEKSISEVEWVKLDVDKSYHSFDLRERIEYTVRTDDPTNIFGDDHEEFITFKIKIVGRAKNSSKAPLFKTFRAIAIT